MLAPFRPPNKKRLRMDLTLQVDGKEKSPTKSLLKRIGNSFRSPFSKKKEADPPQLTDDDSYSEEGEYVDDVDVAQPPSDGPQFSHEEERLAFSAKGKSLLNTPRELNPFVTSLVIQPLGARTTGPQRWVNHYPELRSINRKYIPIYRPSPKRGNQPPSGYPTNRHRVFLRNGNALNASNTSFRFGIVND